MSIIWGAAFAGVFQENLEEVRDRIDSGLLTVIEQGRAVSAAQRSRAYAQRNEYYHAWRDFMRNYDLLLTPTLPVTAFAADEDYPALK